MGFYVVKLWAKGKEGKNEFFTPQNEIVATGRKGAWSNYVEAQKAAMRARLQDPHGRRVTVEEI